MGTTKRTGKRPTKKKATKKAKKPNGKKPGKRAPARAPVVNGGINPLLMDDVDTVSTDLARLLDRVAEQAAHPVADGVYTQAAMGTYLVLEALSRRLSAPVAAALTNLREAALTHRATGGGFESGKVIVSFPQSGGTRSPKWKGEACLQAKRNRALDHAMTQQLHEAERAEIEKAADVFEWDEKAYVKAVQAATTPSALTTNVKFQEGA